MSPVIWLEIEMFLKWQKYRKNFLIEAECEKASGSESKSRTDDRNLLFWNSLRVYFHLCMIQNLLHYIFINGKDKIRSQFGTIISIIGNYHKDDFVQSVMSHVKWTKFYFGHFHFNLQIVHGIFAILCTVLSSTSIRNWAKKVKISKIGLIFCKLYEISQMVWVKWYGSKGKTKVDWFWEIFSKTFSNFEISVLNGSR